jgi:hypothetical protein
MTAAADEFLAFWFDPATQPRWFVKDPTFDQLLRERFGALAARAAAGELDGWANDPRGALALVILLDQLPRNRIAARPPLSARTRGRARWPTGRLRMVTTGRWASSSGFSSIYPMSTARIWPTRSVRCI